MTTFHMSPVTEQPRHHPNNTPKILAAIFIPLMLVVVACCALGVMASRNFCIGYYHGAILPSVLVAPGVAVFSSNHGIRISDGKVLWQDNQMEINTIASDGTIAYYHRFSSVGVTPRVNELVARRLADGAVVWQQSLMDNTNVVQMTLNQDTLFGVMISSTPNGAITGVGISAWLLSDGQSLWQTATPASTSPPFTGGLVDQVRLVGTLIIYSDEHTVYGIEVTTGKLRWQFQDTAIATMIDHVTVGTNDTVIIGKGPLVHYSTPPSQHLIDLATATGTLRWQADLLSQSSQQTRFAPVLGDERVYMIDGPNLIARRSSDGGIIWQAALGIGEETTELADLGTMLVVAGQLSPYGFESSTAALFLLDKATGQITNQLQIANSDNAGKPFPLDFAGGTHATIWVKGYNTSTIIYDLHTLQPLVQRGPLRGTSVLSRIAAVQGNIGLVAYGDVAVNRCPVRHTVNLAGLAANDAHTLWTQTFTLAY